MFSKSRLLLPLAFLIGSAWCFGIGMLLMYYLQNCTGLDCSCPQGRCNPPVETGPGVQEEYDLVVVTKELPHKILYVDSIKNSSLEYGSVYFFDGSSWSTGGLAVGSLKIDEGGALQKFSNTISLEYKLKSASFQLLPFQINTNMTIRAEKKFVKFGGVTSGSDVSLVINGETLPSYAALLKGFNLDYSRIDIADLGVNTNWFVYWDKDWDFYHLDKTDVKKLDPSYESHEFLGEILRVADSSLDIAYPSNIKVSRKAEAAIKGRNDDLSGLSLSYAKGNKSYSLDLDFKERFKRNYLGAISYGGVVTSKEGGIGVFLYIKTQ